MLAPLIAVGSLALAFASLLWTVYVLKRKDVQLKSAHVTYSKIFANTTDAYLSLDLEWSITRMSARAEEIFRNLGKDPQLMMGKVFWTEFPEALGTNVEHEFRRVGAEKVSSSFESFFSSHHQWFEMNAFSTENGVSVFFRNVTPRKLANQETQKALRELNDVKF